MKKRSKKQQPKKWRITKILEAIVADLETAATLLPGRGTFTRGGEASIVLRNHADGITPGTPEEWVEFWHFSLPAAVGLSLNESTVEEVLAALVAEAERLNVPRDA